jgi:RND family efflux transporter MFP subunit
MKTLRWLIVLGIVAAGAGGGGFWLGRHHSESDPADADHPTPSTEPSEEDKPVAQVTVAPVGRQEISETIVAYGTVVAPPGDVRIVSVPFESRVQRVSVVAGQQIGAEDEVIEVEPSPDALVSLAEAKNGLTAAQRDLKQAEQRFADHLCTNVEILQSQQSLQSAQLKLDSLMQRGVGAGAGPKLKAPAGGIVSKIDVQEGQIVPAGAPLLEIASGRSIEVALGVEPGDVAYLKPDQPVQLRIVDTSRSDPIAGRIRTISQRVDPSTRLASILVSLPPEARWMLDTFVEARITNASASALVVPHTAILTEEGGARAIFIVKDGHAKRHEVRLGLQNQQGTQIIADDVKEADWVVIVGPYELKDDMAVEAQQAATQPAATQPPSSEPAAANAGAESRP